MVVSHPELTPLSRISTNPAPRPTWIAWVLEEAGYSVFFQDWDFRGNFVEHMSRSHAQAYRTLTVLSDNYFGSDFTLAEWSARFAQDPAAREDRLVPVKIGPLTGETILDPIAYADLTGCEETEACRRLLARVRQAIDATYRAKPLTRPGFPGRAERKVPEKPNFPGIIHPPPVNPDFVGQEAVLALFHVPLRRNRFFTGREKELVALRQALTGSGAAVVSQVATITGLGGIGKTQTALEYAYRYRDNYRVVWWIEADSAAGLDPGLDHGAAELAAELHLPGADPTSPRRCSLTLSTTPKGHMLITSRNPLWSAVGEPLPLETWLPETAVDFLARRVKCDDPTGAAALAVELDGLPLALEQAAAYIEATGQSFVGYLALYRTRFAELAGAEQFRPKDYPDTVLTTWTLSLAAAEWDNPAAGDLLRLFAFLGPEDIPRNLLIGHAAPGMRKLCPWRPNANLCPGSWVRYNVVCLAG